MALLTGSASINAEARMHENMVRLLGRVRHDYNPARTVSIQEFADVTLHRSRELD
jgi:hypothetical protein